MQALCNGLRTIPVPLVGAFLARLAEESLKPERAGPDLEDLLRQLEEMERSDEQFTEGLRSLGADVEELLGDLRAIRETQVGSEFRLARVRTEENWPVSDNRISALVLNRGGGLVVLEEVEVDVQSWTELSRANLSIPLAPLQVIHLKATLAVETSTYRLFKLNGEGPHQFAQGLGAERLVIDLDSRHNACYRLRLRLSYYDVAADVLRELVWPEPSEPPIEVTFPWAPGWRPDMELVSVDPVLADVEQRVDALADWCRRRRGVEELEAMGIPAHMSPYLPQLAEMLARTVVQQHPRHSGVRRAVERLETAIARPPAPH